MIPRWLFLTFALALPAAPVHPSPPPAVPLSFADFFQPSRLALAPSEKLLALNGKRVQLVGWMARMAEPPQGVFYLCPHPTFCDEEGAGTADLPPTAVRVLTRSAAGQPVRFIPRPIVVTGILSVGPKTEADGTTSNLRLILDGPTQEKREEKHEEVKEKSHATTMEKRGGIGRARTGGGSGKRRADGERDAAGRFTLFA